MAPVGRLFLTIWGCSLLNLPAQEETDEPATGKRPHPISNPQSPRMLDETRIQGAPTSIDYSQLPRLASEHRVVSDVRSRKGVNQHNYLAYHSGQFLLMWSDGPGVEDRVGQRVKYSSSLDGLDWSPPQYLTPEPPVSGPSSPHYNTRSAQGFRWIARGFWSRKGELLALASLDEAAGFFGPSLQLRAFRQDPKNGAWTEAGAIHDDAINNFPPARLPDGRWMMSRRTHDYKTQGVQFLLGGTESIHQWTSVPVLDSASALSAEEPFWWVLPDQNLMALFRDNRKSGFLYRSFSQDGGLHWSPPVQTDFPDATSKFYGLRLRDGRYVLISNSNPRKRDPLTLAVSEDGMVFDRLYYLVGGRHVDYPHALEHDGHLYIAFSGGKQSVEILQIRLSDLE